MIFFFIIVINFVEINRDIIIIIRLLLLVNRKINVIIYYVELLCRRAVIINSRIIVDFFFNCINICAKYVFGKLLVIKGYLKLMSYMNISTINECFVKHIIFCR